MTTANWDAAAGETLAQQAVELAKTGLQNSGVQGDPWVPLTHHGARDFVLSCMFQMEQLLYLSGLRSVPTSLDAVLKPFGIPVSLGLGTPSPPTFGDGYEVARGHIGSRPTTANEAAAILHYAAMSRALRQLVLHARPWAGTAKPVDDTKSDVPMIPAGIVVPIVVVVVVLGVAALAANAWTDVEASRNATALKMKDIELVGQLKVAGELAAKQLAAGQPVDVPGIVASLGKKEILEQSYLPWVAGGLGVVTAGLVIHSLVK